MTKPWIRKLQAMGACEEAVIWAKTQPSLKVAWAKCQNPAWMLWLIAKTIQNDDMEARRKVVRIACACAQSVAQYSMDPRTQRAIDTARKVAEGPLPNEEASEASWAASAATRAASWAANAASEASWAASRAASCDLIRKEFPTPPQPRRAA